ncbi:MAG: MarR family transcriptional regulator [Thermoanaerobacteraceae bacterium]|nr:MarR family transcriptional regulator [Thermoanaerobacteraceae bacterium]
MGKTQSIGRWISVLYRYGQSYLDKKLHPYNLSSGQFIFLVVLLEKDGVSQEFLAKRLNIDKATTARAIKKMEQAGYVVRKVDPEDKRARIIYVTDKALRLKPVLKNISEEWTGRLTEDFTVQEREIIFQLLQKMSRNAALLVKAD